MRLKRQGGRVMTGKERWQLAMERRTVDRPPFDYWTEEVTKAQLLEYLGYNDVDKFLDEAGVDIRGVNAIEPPEKDLGGGVFQNHWGERYMYRKFPLGKLRDDMPGALSSATSFEDIKNFTWPKNNDYDYSKLRSQCDAIRSKGCAIRYGSGDVFQRPTLVRGLENALMDLYENPEYIKYMSRLFTDFYLEEYRRAWEESGGSIDMFVVYSDVGSQRGPLISLDMFDEFVVPYLTEMAELIHHFGAKLLFHSCGDVSSFIPAMIKTGVDILDPVQPVNENMFPENLARFKDGICFHGGIDLQKFLINASAEEIREKAHYYYRILGPGYILGPTHYFQPDVPSENIVALYRSF
jgi:uroporphyrinogen decarboxylase